MRNFFLILIVLASVITCFFSCQSDISDSTEETKKPLTFSFTLPEGLAQARKHNSDLGLAVKAILTITKDDGTATDYTKAELELYESEGMYYLEEIFLPPGNYKILEFYLLDEKGTAVFAIPQAGKLQEYLDQILPISFTIEKIIKEETMVIEVLSTEGFTPEEFGFDPEEIKFEPLFYFLVALSDKYDPEKFLIGEMHITSNLGYDIAIDSAANILFKEEYIAKGEIDISVQVEGYAEYRYSFSKDSLLQFSDTPLMIKLEKIQDEENVYKGNVVLTSQEEVDEFGGKRYGYLLGNLKISDLEEPGQQPIQELRQLQSLRKVDGNFIVKDNPSLKIFQGMVLNEVTGDFVLENNPKVKDLSGLHEFRMIGGTLTILNNLSLVDYCAISKLFYESPGVQLEIKGNAYNPTKEEIRNYKTCSID